MGSVGFGTAEQYLTTFRAHAARITGEKGRPESAGDQWAGANAGDFNARHRWGDDDLSSIPDGQAADSVSGGHFLNVHYYRAGRGFAAGSGGTIRPTTSSVRSGGGRKPAGNKWPEVFEEHRSALIAGATRGQKPWACRSGSPRPDRNRGATSGHRRSAFQGRPSTAAWIMTGAGGGYRSEGYSLPARRAQPQKATTRRVRPRAREDGSG